jgi:hypothetical protein
MTHLVALSLRLRWLGVPGALLLLLLQRAPAVRPALAAGERLGASPLGAGLRSAVAAATALGGLHTLAGATAFVQSPSGTINGTVGTAVSVGFTYTGTPTPVARFSVAGSLPPGLAFTPAPNGGLIQSGTPIISGTPTQAGSFSVRVQGFNNTGRTDSVQHTIAFAITGPAGTAPSFSAQPAAQTAAVGAPVTFSATATGTAPITFQWRKDGALIVGATGASYTIASVQVSDGGVYAVSATNATGTATSTTAALIVTAPAGSPPAIAAQPLAQTVAAGSTVVFSVAATGTPAPSYQWRRDGNNIADATTATLVLSGTTGATAALAGAYSVSISNGNGAPVISTPAALTLATAPVDVGRLVNLSILTSLSSGEKLTMGTAIGGAGTTGSKPLVARAAGPALAQLGLTGLLPDPTMKLNNTTGSAFVVDQNNDWGGSATLANVFASVGAFGYASATSRDAAIFHPGLDRGNYTVEINDNGAGNGTVIAELYDATPASAFSATTPRLINVSVLKNIPASGSLTAGFFVGGATARTVLIRAIGPGLSAVGVTSGTLADPQLTLFNSAAATVAANDNWGGDPQLTATGNRVGAFAVSNAASRDAMILATLAPDSYTARMTPVSGTPGGLMIIEVYEVP